MTRGLKHLACVPSSECPVYGATDRLSVGQLVETADMPVKPECLVGVPDSFGLNVASETPGRQVIGGPMQSEVDVLGDGDRQVHLPHRHPPYEGGCVEHLREVIFNAQAEWRGQTPSRV
jgi:hypothetical protein